MTRTTRTRTTTNKPFLRPRQRSLAVKKVRNKIEHVEFLNPNVGKECAFCIKKVRNMSKLAKIPKPFLLHSTPSRPVGPILGLRLYTWNVWRPLLDFGTFRSMKLKSSKISQPFTRPSFFTSLFNSTLNCDFQRFEVSTENIELIRNNRVWALD